jgi:hypothetical protein
VKIEPHLGVLKKASGEMPHPQGKIGVKYLLEKGKWKISITIPEKLPGRFIWEGRQYILEPGENSFLF